MKDKGDNWLTKIKNVLDPDTWPLKTKIRLSFLPGAFFVCIVIVFIVLTFQKNILIQNSYDTQNLLRKAKTEQVEQYLNSLSSVASAFASNPEYTSICQSFTNAFMQIENDNYQTEGAENLDRIYSLLKSYYATEINSGNSEFTSQMSVENIVPAAGNQSILQYLYIADNTRPVGQKHLYSKAPDGSIYSSMHSEYHPQMLELMNLSAFNDLLLVDFQTGNIVYSVKKNPDFASNLYDGIYRNSALANAFKKAAASPSAGSVFFTDVTLYPGAGMKPVFFISVPLYSYNVITGVAIFEISTDAFDKILALPA